MKTNKDPRHLERVKMMQELFAWEFRAGRAEKLDEVGENLEVMLSSLDKIDELIHGAAPSWPIDKINKIDLAILRLATYEIIIEKKAPPKVVVDEAVELAKEYGADNSASFINGALGKLITDNKIQV